MGLSKDVRCAALKFPALLLNLRFTRCNATDFAKIFCLTKKAINLLCKLLHNKTD